MFDNIFKQQQKMNNSLINESERNDTIVNKIPNSSIFDKSFFQGLTFNSGKAIPVLLQECYPGDIYKIDTQSIIRLSTPSSTPLMNINCDINFFFIPYSQIDKEFHELMGENNEYGYSDTNIGFPQLEVDVDFEYNENDLANYFNIPINTNFKGESLNIYPFLAYGKVVNEWYREQNVQGTIDITTCFNEDRKILASSYQEEMTYYQKIIFGKDLAPTNKLPSYYTSALPYQQKGQPILVGDSSKLKVVNDKGEDKVLFSPQWMNDLGNPSSNQVKLGANGALGETYEWGGPTWQTTYGRQNLALKLSGDLFPTINDLRYSIVTQHLLENWALCGSRYVEQLSSIWGIQIDPKNINRSELIGGINNDLIFSPIVQTSETTQSSNLGKIASNLMNQFGVPTIEYACSQHGFIIGIMTCRTRINNGGQGLPKIFSYKNHLSLFNPLYNGIGEQPMKNKELFYNGVQKEENEKTFGFVEPFLNTKYNIDNANGFMSLNSRTSLFPMFLFGEKYNETPKLCEEWMKFNENIIGNTLYKVGSNTYEFYHQFVGGIYYKIEYCTKQPLFNSPKVYGI